MKNRAQYFKNNPVMSARKALGIHGRFYTNGLELEHKLQKKLLEEADIPKEVSAVTAGLQTWPE
jgi:hypothetical protein